MTVLEHTNTWPEEVLKRFNSSREEVLEQVFYLTHTLTLKQSPWTKKIYKQTI